jgi:3-phytase
MLNKNFIASISTVILLASCSHTQKINPTSKFLHFKMNNSPSVGKTISGQDIFLGGFSGLIFEKESGGAYFFKTITDRGPNGWSEGNERPFLIPEFSPQIVSLKADPSTMKLEVVDRLPLKQKNGNALSGLPNKRDEENPTDLFGLMYSLDPNGLDTESLAKDQDGSFWVGEEYAPSIVHFDQNGKMIKRLNPGLELPKIYLERKPNRGFEGVAIFENHVWGILQSPLPKEEGVARIVEVDTETNKATAEYFYPFEKGNEKIGDLYAIGPKTFIVLEQNGKIGKESSKLVFKFTINESDKKVEKKLIADLKNTPFNDVEKVEGLTMINNRQIALCLDNDFQISGKTNRDNGITPLNNLTNQILIISLEEDLISNR